MHDPIDPRRHEPSPAGNPLSGLSPEEQLAEVQRLLRRAEANSLAVFDQLFTQLRQTAAALAEVVIDSSLPPGQRVPLVASLVGLLRSAILGLEYEVQVGAGVPDVHLQALAPLLEVQSCLVEARVEARAREIALELTADEDHEGWGRYADYSRLHSHELILAEGAIPSDQAIEAWLRRSPARRRG